LKILAVSDLVVDRFYRPEVREIFRDVGLVLGCGDLPYEYLEFLVSSLNVPLLYVPGNHDPQFNARNPASQAEGCEILDRQVRRVKGLTIAGIGGSMRYQPDRPNQYTQVEMYVRLSTFLPSLLWHRFRPGGSLDIVIAHSPPRGIHDDNDIAHTGFSAYVDFIRIFKPRYFLHGHTMVYKNNLVPPVTQVGGTSVINIYPYQIMEVEPHGG
jgi:Icc-related predicted phosphoesterase